MPKRAVKVFRFVLRWTIAVVGVVWVISQIHLDDRVRVLDEQNIPFEAVLDRAPEGEASSQFEYRDPATGQIKTVGRDRLVSSPDRKTVKLVGKDQPVPLLGVVLARHTKTPTVERLLVQDAGTQRGVFVPPDATSDYELDVPNPLIERGAATMVREADGKLLLASVAVLPLTYIFTTFRWQRLLAALGIVLPLSRTFVLNMVGCFYSTFMPGSTGGDVLKAYYAAKAAPSRRTGAVMSVIVDRGLGLLALIMLGGVMAAIQYAMAPDKSDRVARACLHVSIIAVALLGATLAASVVIYWRGLRHTLGLNLLLTRLPMQPRIQKIVDVVRLYRQRPLLIVWAIFFTLPVHATVVVSAMLAGNAFGLPISNAYYFTVVPVVVLVGAIPISPQGVGVMEAFAFYLTKQQGATVNQALALTMSIRLVQMFWNLSGGLFVLRGGYHTPTEKEQAELEAESGDGVRTPAERDEAPVPINSQMGAPPASTL